MYVTIIIFIIALLLIVVYTGCPKIGVQTTYYLIKDCLNIHEKNMEKMFPTKKSIIFIIINGNTM
jgi:hypothetical protein